MNFEETKRLINNVIENEFHHIQETQELTALKKDNERFEEYNKADELLKHLIDNAPEEYKNMLEDYDELVNSVMRDYCRYYFERGVISGMTNLKFLKDTNIIGAL
ncbi:hypothetical protein [Clostridium sp. C2-6-12]|uniref:hypothetical protein n=1 Tax=Clostridium sp. C2-6-12 TaxID=2698832 RepID=UPI001368DE0B|nr:hypothetical protein [Clostridium sp. C2-6-12]